MGASLLVLFAKYDKNEEVKEDEMGSACSTHGGKRNVYMILAGNLAAKRPLGRPRHRWHNSIIMGKIVDNFCGLLVRVPGYRSRGSWFDSRRYHNSDRLCGLVVRVLGYRYTSPRFDCQRYQISEKLWVWNGVYSAS
jgi:hypothetical protein